ncbi:hypothetical protein [Yersinia proxima]|uniref:hypothetical protein n=2 Tax=Yersinia proxima TaxID=2890316 RepID=UPI003D6931FE
MELVRKTRKQVYYVVLVTVIIYTSIVVSGLRGCFNGNFDQYLVPGKYAAPQNITAHGFENKVFPKDSSGWDGQFYYYHSDDPLLLRDTSSHIDMPAYRAQRVGIPAIAYLVSRALGQSWTSPTIFFSVNVGLQLIATFIIASFLYSKGLSPWMTMLWATSGATLYTAAFGLIDGSADALLLISLILLSNKKIKGYLILMSLAVLSKESYIIIPIAITISHLIYYLYSYIKYENIFNLLDTIKVISYNLIPIIIGLSWLLYLHIHLNTDSFFSKVGAEMMSVPFQSIFNYIHSGLHRKSFIASINLTPYTPTYKLLIGLILFLVLNISTLLIPVYNTIYSIKETLSNLQLLNVSSAIIALSAAYTCLSAIQLWEPVGFVKASSLLIGLFIIYTAVNNRNKYLIVTITSALLAIYSYVVIYERISVNPMRADDRKILWVTEQPECLTSANILIYLISIDRAFQDTILNNLIMPKRYIASVKITNKSEDSLSPFKGKGTINVGYQWFSPDGATLLYDGNRVPISHTLKYGDSDTVSFIVNPPPKNGNYTLRVTLVQEGCNWLYNINPSIKNDIKLKI